MNKYVDIKVISIVALVVAIVGMSLGFAAFSSMLTISSSATVSPNDADFKLTIYGMSEEGLNNFNKGVFMTPYEKDIYTDRNYSYALNYTDNEATVAVIDNTNFTINNISATITDMDNFPSWVTWYFMVSNEGEYDVYFDIPNVSLLDSCVAEEGTSQSLVDNACQNMKINFFVYEDGGTIVRVGNKYKIPKGSYMIFYYQFEMSSRDSMLTDGAYRILSDDLKLTFTTSNS